MSYCTTDTGRMVLIGEHNWQQFTQDVMVDGVRRARGYVPRDYNTHPLGFYGTKETTSLDIALINPSEYDERIADTDATQSGMMDMRNIGMDGAMIPSRDQNGKGYCWAHSGVSAHLILRAMAGLPYADLSAYSIACKIKNFADQGGWGAQGLDFQTEKGCATSKTWPQQGMSRSYDNPETWAEAAKYKIIEGWIDLASAQYDRNLTWAQTCTCLLSRIPVIVDYNWWGHSVCAVKLIKALSMWKKTRGENGKLLALKLFDIAWGTQDPVTGGYAVIIWNSWGNSWSDNGMGALSGSKSVPDGSVAPRTVSLAA